MLRRVALVRTDVSEELSASLIRVTRIGELGTKSTVTSKFLRVVLLLLVTAKVVSSSPNLATLMMGGIRFSEASFLTRLVWRNNTNDGILHSHRRKNLKPYIVLTGWAL
jgi:hypothetical protein